MFGAIQTLSDYEARTRSAAMANQLIGNTNTTIMLRTLDPDTQERLSKRLPEVLLTYVMKTTGTSLGETTVTGAYSINHGERLMQEDKPIISPQLFGDISDLEFFAVPAKGDILKGRLPILIAPEENDHDPTSSHYSKPTKAKVYDHEASSLPKVIDRQAIEVPEPPIFKPDRELTGDDAPIPPHRLRLLPIPRLVDTMPDFRPSENEPPPELDPYFGRCGIIDDLASYGAKPRSVPA